MQEHFSNEKKRNDKMGKAELNKQNKRTSLLQAAFDLFWPREPSICISGINTISVTSWWQRNQGSFCRKHRSI